MNTEKNKKSLFDHVNHVLYKRERDYFSNGMTIEEQKDFSSFMVNRIISNDLEGAYFASILDKTSNVFGKEGYYKMAINLLPKKKYNTFGSNGNKKKEEKNTTEFKKELIRCVKMCYVDISEKQAKEYIDILTKDQKLYILEVYSMDSEKFTKHIK
jgi:hypothetical protein